MPLRYESNLMKPSARLAGLLSDGITEEKKNGYLYGKQPLPFSVCGPLSIYKLCSVPFGLLVLFGGVCT